MFVIDRHFVCTRLAISEGSSYRLLPRNELAYLNSDSVVRLLNRSGRGHEPELDYIPSDIITPEQAESETGIPSHKLLVWTRRRVKVPPHFRLTKHITRFRRSSLNDWLSRRISR